VLTPERHADSRATPAIVPLSGRARSGPHQSHAAVDRLSIRTYVPNSTWSHNPRALLREHYRGGQSFSWCPITTARKSRLSLQYKVPEVSYVIAHGQMGGGRAG